MSLAAHNFGTTCDSSHKTRRSFSFVLELLFHRDFCILNITRYSQMRRFFYGRFNFPAYFTWFLIFVVTTCFYRIILCCPIFHDFVVYFLQPKYELKIRVLKCWPFTANCYFWIVDPVHKQKGCNSYLLWCISLMPQLRIIQISPIYVLKNIQYHFFISQAIPSHIAWIGVSAIHSLSSQDCTGSVHYVKINYFCQHHFFNTDFSKIMYCAIIFLSLSCVYHLHHTQTFLFEDSL